MAVKSIVKVSELYTSKRLGAEFYHPVKLRALQLLKGCTSESVQDYFANARNVFNPAKGGITISNPTFVFDLSDIESHFLGEGVAVSSAAEVGSTKKIFRARDILISRLRPYLHEIALAERSEALLLGSTEFVVLREKKESAIPAEFLFVFLMIREVQDILLWSQEGTNHPRFPESIIFEMPLPRPDESTREYVAEHVKQASGTFRESFELYLQAEQMLLTELGLDKLSLSQSNYCTIPLSQAQKVNRMDAGHFQPKYNCLLQYIAKEGHTDYLGNLVTQPIRRGLQPTYVEEGEVIVVNSQHLGRYLLNIQATERTNGAFWKSNERCQLQKNDVLFYSTGAYIGRTNAWLEDQQAIASNHVTIIRPNATCNPLYLSVYLNALPGLMQAERWASGSGQQEIYPEDIARFIVYLPYMEFQERIADLVTQSWQARQKATGLLKEAKRKVEDVIERAVSG